jgi:dual specificity tyrosine-phosphorylation-regulated kinase 2/3/4
MAFPINSSIIKLALHEVQKSARGDGSSTGRKSNKSGKDTLKSDERSKLRDLRSIFYKKSSCKNGSEKTSARNRSSSKILSKNSSSLLKNSIRSSHKRSSKMLKKDVSPMRDKTLTLVDSKGKNKLLNIINPFSNSKSLLRSSKSRKKSPKAHSLGKKKLSKIKLNGRNNKFMNNIILKKSGHNVSNMNSARSKNGAPSGSKESKKSIKIVKRDYILKPGEGKLRFSKKVKDSVLTRPKLVKKNPLKVLKKISIERDVRKVEKSAFNIAIDRVSQYNNYCKLSGRTKQSSDSGSNVLIRKNSNISRKNRDNSNSRGNKTHLIFMDQQHNAKLNDTKVRNTNFNLSGPVNLRQENSSLPFDSNIMKAKHQASITRDSNKSQQQVPDANSTLAYTAAWASSGMGQAKPIANTWILGSVPKPADKKYSPHTLYFKRHKKSKESPYWTSGSGDSNIESGNKNPRGNSYVNDYALPNSHDSNSGIASDASSLSKNVIGAATMDEERKYSTSYKISAEKTYREKPKVQKEMLKVKIIEDYGAKEQQVLEEKKTILNTKAPHKIHESVITASSPSRGSVLTNPQQPGGRFGSSLNNSNTQDNYPLKPGKAIQMFKNVLTEYEKGEILNYREIYWVGEGAANKKIKGSLLKDNNWGFDDDRGDYNVIEKDHLAYRFEIMERLGQGSFGQAYKCLDQKTGDTIAVKIIKNDPSFQYQAGVEVKILTHLRDKDPYDKNNIIRLIEVFTFREHLWVVFELLSINLYDFLKQGNFRGLSLGLIRRFAMQILYALNYVKCENIIHCDLKPENIILKDKNKSGLKVIDFGSSCFADEQLYTYIQSRFYRAPEIVFGIRYSNAIDMWSFGCILAELFTGYPIFPGENEHDQIGYIMELNGLPPIEVLRRGKRSHLFFEPDGLPIAVPNSEGKVRMPNTKYLHEVLDWTDESFLDFLEQWFEWTPENRLTPTTALSHEWILEGLPVHILEHHMTLHNIDVADLPTKIRKNFEKYMRSKDKNSAKDLTLDSAKSGKKALSTGRKPVKHKIDTDIFHVAEADRDMVTLRNKDKKVNIKKGLEDSLLDSLSSKSKSNTRNKEKHLSSKADFSLSNGGDSLQALDDIMPISTSKKTNNGFVLKKNNIKFKPIRRGMKSKAKRQDNKLNLTRDSSADYKSLPHKISEHTEQSLANGQTVKQSRNKIIESFAPAELNNMISKGKSILKNNFFA